MFFGQALAVGVLQGQDADVLVAVGDELAEDAALAARRTERCGSTARCRRSREAGEVFAGENLHDAGAGDLVDDVSDTPRTRRR
jgi:hypothetical protein